MCTQITSDHPNLRLIRISSVGLLKSGLTEVYCTRKSAYECLQRTSAVMDVSITAISHNKSAYNGYRLELRNFRIVGKSNNFTEGSM